MSSSRNVQWPPTTNPPPTYAHSSQSQSGARSSSANASTVPFPLARPLYEIGGRYKLVRPEHGFLDEKRLALNVHESDSAEILSKLCYKDFPIGQEVTVQEISSRELAYGKVPEEADHALYTVSVTEKISKLLMVPGNNITVSYECLQRSRPEVAIYESEICWMAVAKDGLNVHDMVKVISFKASTNTLSFERFGLKKKENASKGEARVRLMRKQTLHLRYNIVRRLVHDELR